MDGSANGLLESVTYKTLHAQNFNRASSKASHVLTNLISRYITLLASTCARYAEHAGRTSVSMSDAFNALEEVGVSVEELTEYVESDGIDMMRYTPCTSRRMEEMTLLREALEEGRRIDRDDAIPLFYAKVPDERDLEEIDEEDSHIDRMDEDEQPNHINGDVSMTCDEPRSEEKMRSLTLPLSPISRPVSPSRKRPRLPTWNPPPHIPDFLPPFPTTTVSINGSSSRAQTPQPQIKQEAEAATPSSTDMGERGRIPEILPQQLATATSAADYLTPVPYNMSELNALPQAHLPDRQHWRHSISDPGNSLQLQPRRHPIPEVEQALMGAYHHLLTNPSPRTPSTNPNRHRVALAMIAQAYKTSRWMPADSIFGNVAPPRPRIVAPGPTYPILLTSKKDDQVPILPTASKPIAPPETQVSLSFQVGSRIPDISKAVLPPGVVFRASKLNPPPPLANVTSGDKFLYGTGVPAPWNANNLSQSAAAASGPKKKGKSGAGDDDDGEGVTKDKAREESVLSDAILLATWDWESHDYRMPPVHAKRPRALGSFTLNADGVMPVGEPIRRNSIKIGKAK